MNWIKKELAPWLVFPMTMGLGLWSCIYLMAQGIHPALAALEVVIVALVLIAFLERLLPYRGKWNQSDNDVAVDWIHMLIAQLAIPRLAKPLWMATLVAMTAWAATAFGGKMWPHHWPLVAQMFLMLVIAEFGRYWVHRLAHESAFMWRLHAVHHSPNRLYFLNAGRFHPLEKILFLIPEVVPFIIMGTNAQTLALYGVFNSIHGLFQHSNIHVKGGFLNYIFSMTELHRWHHSKKIKEADHNYGNNLIIWDIIFGTFYWPKEREVGEVGLLNPEYPKSYVGHLTAPFAKTDISKPKGWIPEDTETTEEHAGIQVKVIEHHRNEFSP